MARKSAKVEAPVEGEGRSVGTPEDESTPEMKKGGTRQSEFRSAPEFGEAGETLPGKYKKSRRWKGPDGVETDEVIIEDF